MSGEFTRTDPPDKPSTDPAPLAPGSASPAGGAVSRLKAVLRRDAGRLLSTGVLHLLMALLATKGISLFQRVILVHVLSLADIGRMVFVMQITEFLALAADFGIFTSVLKYAAEPIPDRERERIYFMGLVWSSVLSGAMCLTYLLIAMTVSLHSDVEVRVFLLVVTPYIAIRALARIPMVFMQACKEIKRAAKYTLITQVISLVAVVGATTLFGLWGFFVVMSVAPLSNLLILLAVTRHRVHWFRPTLAWLKKLLGLGLPSMAANAVGLANAAGTVIVLRYLTKSDEAVGLFGIAFLVFTGLRQLVGALMQTAFPYLSGLLNNPDRLFQRMHELRVKQSLVMAGVASAWAAVGWLVLPLIFGSPYRDSYWVSVWLVAGLVPFGWYSPAGYTLIVLGKVHLNLMLSSILLVISISLCVILVPIMGTVGAGVSMFVAMMFAAVVSSVIVRSVLRKMAASRENTTDAQRQ